MPHRQILKFILDIEAVIAEIEQLQNFCDNRFDRFVINPLAIRASERLLEIIGEAVNQMRKIDPKVKLSNTVEIVGLRNKIVHAYDSIDPALLWGIIIEDIPILKSEIQQLKGKN